MTKVRIYGIILGALFVAALIVATFPMRLALEWGGSHRTGLSARAVNGSIWSAHLADTHWGALALGDLNISLSPMSVLVGDGTLNFTRSDAQLPPLSGQLSTGAAIGVSNVNGSVDTGLRIGGLSLGKVQMTNATAKFDSDGHCAKAEGQVQLALATPIAGLALAQGLSGPLRCAEGMLQALLPSQSGMETIYLTLNGKGAWQARFLVAQASDPVMIGALGNMGFRVHSTGYVMTAAGTL